jgi:protein associated with RNAse G/E
VTGREVRVVYTKYDGSLHWHQTMQYLGEDEHGIWLGAPAGNSARRGSEPPIVIQHPQALLSPDGKWWTAVFYGESARSGIYCDISTPPHWPHEGEVTMVDLDLDVLRLNGDEQVRLLDEDEFAEHQVRYAYPAEVISRAVQTAAWLQEAITAGTEPFRDAFRPWLALVS